MHRSHTCGEITTHHIGQTVTLAGWVDNIRNMGKFGFLTVRDRYGITQISLDETMMQSDIVQSLHYEDCIQISGVVAARPTGQENLEMSTGAIEIVASEITLIGKSKEIPFQIVDDPATSEEQRFKHRYLDLRRKKVLNTVMTRAKMNHITRNWFTDKGFLEVQTPLFTVSSPEGARDYLIPSRVNPGKCYALPQAPQQYKQLLMIGGIDKYFQIAPCFRDEDPRADRHSCEFYQIDVEMSFVHQEDVHAVAQQYIQDMVPQICTKRIIDPVVRLPFLAEYTLPGSSLHFPKIPYDRAMELFGSDKPDLRFDGHMVDVTELFRASEASFIATPLAQGAVFKAILLQGHLPTRKEIDVMTDVAKQAGAGGLPYIQLDGSELKGSIAKFIDTTTLKSLAEQTGFADGDTLLFVLGTSDQVAKIGNKIRMDIRDRFHLVDTTELAFAWIVNFPFFEVEDGKVDFGHNPFSMVTGGIETLRQVIEEGKDPATVISEQYDMICNGYEILSGSIRNNSVEVLVKAFEFVGKTEADVKTKFGAMYEAFQYGCPPHGGFAFGFDRLLMILIDEPNIREVYAFPKSGKAEDIMMGAPSMIDQEQLDELGMKFIDV